ncbi:MAG: GNAT family N-acetyltransferase [Candidatus Onthomonas sp.]
MELTIQTERPCDWAEAERVTREAFWNCYCPGCCEHYLLHTMRTCPAFVPELSLVALDGQRLVGHVAQTKGQILGDDGTRHEVLTLGPISVLPEYQRQGVGSCLLAASRKRARALGYQAILLLGDPAYYGRQGFRPAEELGIRTADGCYADALQACELTEGALDGAAGRYLEDAVYEVDLDAAAAFDRQFPPKEPLADTPAQRRFREVASRRRKAE